MRVPIKTSLKLKFINTLSRLKSKGFYILASGLGLVLDVIELSLESFFRFILLAMPLGLYKTLLEAREKPSTAGAIGMHLTHESTFQIVAPGVLLVSIDGGKKYKSDMNELKLKWSKVAPRITNILRVLAYSSVVVIALAVVFYILQYKGF